MPRSSLVIAATALCTLALVTADAARADEGTSPHALGRPALPRDVRDAGVASPARPWDAAPRRVAEAALVGGADAYRYRAGPTDACDPCDRWRLALTLPIWIPSVTGTFASGDSSIDADREPGGVSGVLDDLLPEATTQLEFAFMGRVEVTRGPWTFLADGFWVSLEETLDWKLRDEDTTGNLDGTVGRFLSAWQTRVPLGCGPCAPELAVGPLLGARVFRLDLEVDPAAGDPGDAVDRSKTWVDVLGGVKADVTFANGARFGVLADFGGGPDGSHTSWSVTAELAWPLGRGGHWFVLAGWTVLDLDYDLGNDGDDDRYKADLHLSGPHIGFTYLF